MSDERRTATMRRCEGAARVEARAALRVVVCARLSAARSIAPHEPATMRPSWSAYVVTPAELRALDAAAVLLAAPRKV